MPGREHGQECRRGRGRRERSGEERVESGPSNERRR
jgi:hypothetical protein